MMWENYDLVVRCNDNPQTKLLLLFINSFVELSCMQWESSLRPLQCACTSLAGNMEVSNCTEIPQDVDEEIFFQPPPWLAFLVVFIGIVVTIIVVLVLYGCRVFIWKIVSSTTFCQSDLCSILWSCGSNEHFDKPSNKALKRTLTEP